MNRDDLILVKNIIDSIERDLTKEESNLLDRINTILEFDEVQTKFNKDTKAFNEKMKALSEKAGE
jgi:hypothetical protein